jgi:thiamine biosynthesis protein ThiS
MIIKVNGKDLNVQEGATILSVVESEKFVPEKIVVEYNKEIIPGSRLGEVYVSNKDSIEILSFVGGG